MFIVIRFALLFTVFVTLLSHTGFNISSAMSDLRKTMDSFSIIPEVLDLITVTLRNFKMPNWTIPLAAKHGSKATARGPWCSATSVVPNFCHMGRAANMYPEPSAEIVNTRHQKRLQLTENVRKPSHRERVSIGTRTFHKPLSHEPTVGHSSNVTWFWIFVERLYVAPLFQIFS